MNVARVFVDTGAWVAIQITDDDHHVEAVRTFEELLALPAVLITTNQVVGETYTLLRVTRGHAAAARFLRSIEETRRLERVFVAEEIETRAFALLAQYRDHAFSFVDATSLVLMRATRLRFAFAFDSHFATAGFLRLPIDAAVEDAT